MGELINHLPSYYKPVSSSSLSDLPNELIISIIAYLPHFLETSMISMTQWDDAKNFSITSKRMRQLASPFLFSELQLRSPFKYQPRNHQNSSYDFKPLEINRSDEGSFEIIKYIDSIRFTGDIRFPTSQSEHALETLKEYVDYISTTRRQKYDASLNVFSLYLILTGGRKLILKRKDSIESLAELISNLSGLTTLNLLGDSHFHHIAKTFLDRILIPSCFKSLRKLTLQFLKWWKAWPTSDSFKGVSTSSNLRCLSVFLLPESSSFDSLLRNLFSNFNNLEILIIHSPQLDIVWPWNFKRLHAILYSCQDSLKSLRIHRQIIQLDSQFEEPQERTRNDQEILLLPNLIVIDLSQIRIKRLHDRNRNSARQRHVRLKYFGSIISEFFSKAPIRQINFTDWDVLNGNRFWAIPRSVEVTLGDGNLYYLLKKILRYRNGNEREPSGWKELEMIKCHREDVEQDYMVRRQCEKLKEDGVFIEVTRIMPEDHPGTI